MIGARMLNKAPFIGANMRGTDPGYGCAAAMSLGTRMQMQKKIALPRQKAPLHVWVQIFLEWHF